MSDAIWVIEISDRYSYRWKYYSTEDDISEPEEMQERLKKMYKHGKTFRGVMYTRDETSIVDRPVVPTDPHSRHRECASRYVGGEVNHCQHYHKGGTCCDCGIFMRVGKEGASK